MEVIGPQLNTTATGGKELSWFSGAGRRI